MSLKEITRHLAKWQCNSFEHCVINLNEHLDFLLQKHYPKTSPEKIKAAILSNINSGKIKSAELDTSFDIITKFPGNLEITSLHYLESAISTLLVAENLHSTGNTVQAFSTLTLYALNIGQLDELLENAHACVLPSYDDVRRKEIGGLGGVGKANRSKPAHDELISLIINKRPKNGWISKNSAAQQLSKYLFDFIKHNSIPLREDSLPDTIKRWFREVPEINDAISSTLKKKNPS